MAKWIFLLDGPRIYVLSGLAGIGKSTVAQTVAKRADDLRSLGASFFFSRDEIDRRDAKKFFTTIASQLCVYNVDFAQAIGNALFTERGYAAISKEPLEQLQMLILEPLRGLAPQVVLPIVIVVDALDECDEADGPTVLSALNLLVRELPFFKVILTTRPQPHLQHLLEGPNTHKIFHLQNIEDKVVDSDIRLYLKYKLSLQAAKDSLPTLRYQWSADDEEIDTLVQAAGRLFIIASTVVLFILDTAARDPRSQMKRLLAAFAENHTPFRTLNGFYTVILRSALPI